ncbi:MAG TPA: sugar transferase [Candidatus Sumerlaeota bacterium]|nr:sugar transferase [Candidatus Sumerlaeota bacterium]HPK01285.1 sugar transferase [Candidatus Sumerlaeota bacterium]
MGSFWKSHFVTLCLLAIDVIALSILWGESWELIRAFDHRFVRPINPKDLYLQFLPALLLIWVAVLAFFHQYDHRLRISSLNQVSDILKAGFVLLLVTLAFANLTKRPTEQLANRVIMPFCVGATAYLYASRSLLRIVKDRMRKAGVGLTRAAIIGAGETGRRVALRIQTHPEIGYELVGFIDRRAAELGATIAGIPVIGDGSRLVDLLLQYRIEEVFLAVPNMDQHAALDLVVECEAANVHFKIVKNDLLQVITDRVKIDEIGDFPVILLREGRLTPAGALLKRAMDLVLTVPLFILSLPLMAVIAICIKLDSRGPVLFVHDRVGQDGRIFKLIKFRTMTTGANPYAVAPSAQSDPRVTRFGRFLRKTSLDELPQLWNVLRGDMSLVGPRPEMPFIVEQYTPWQRRRLDVPQGITGLWQIAGRKQLPLHYNLEYDFYYIRNWSLLLDIVILIRTIPAVLLGKGAF